MENSVSIEDFLIKTNSSKIEEVKEDYQASLIHLHDTNEDGEVVKDNLYIGKCRVTDNFNIGNMSEDTATIAVGGLGASTLGDLKQKSMSEIIMNMVCPLTYPTKKTSPSITLSYSGSTLIEVGSTLPNKDDITVSTNGGKWSDGTAYYGTCDDVTITMSPENWGGTSEEKIYTISGSGVFTAGGMSKDSHGNDYQQMSGGSVSSSNSISIVSVYPIYINNEDITVMKSRLVNYNTLQTIYVTIPEEIDGTSDKFKIYLPSTFSTFEVKQLNTVSGKYDITVNMVLIDGETSKYIRTKQLDTKQGSSQYEIKLKK